MLPLHVVVIDGKPTVLQVHLERRPVVAQVVQGFGESALGQDPLRRFAVQHLLQPRHHRHALLLPQCQPRGVVPRPSAVFDVIQFPDQRQDLAAQARLQLAAPSNTFRRACAVHAEKRIRPPVTFSMFT